MSVNSVMVAFFPTRFSRVINFLFIIRLVKTGRYFFIRPSHWDYEVHVFIYSLSSLHIPHNVTFDYLQK